MRCQVACAQKYPLPDATLTESDHRILPDLVRLGQIRSHLFGFAPIRLYLVVLNLVLFGPLRYNSVRFGRTQSDLVGLCQIWSDLDGFGRTRSDLVEFGRILSDSIGLGRTLSDFG